MSDTRQQRRGEATRLDSHLLKVGGVCLLADIAVNLDVTVVTVAQRTLVTEFDSTQAIVAWTVAGYLLAMATTIPLAGWAADRLGTKRLFIGSVLVFTIGSLLCALASNIPMLVAFRVVQGLGGGMLMPVVITIVRLEAGPHRMGRLMALLGIPIVLAPVAGPIVGGWIIESFNWSWIFLVNIPVGLLTILLAAMVLRADQPNPSEAFDVIGLLLLAPGLAMLLYSMSLLPEWGNVAKWQIWVPLAVGLVMVIAFALRALFGTVHPLLDLRLFTNSPVALANLTTFVFITAVFGVAVLLPSYFQQVMGDTPTQSGLRLIPQSLGVMLTMPIAGWIMDKTGPGRVVLVGIAVTAVGMGTLVYAASSDGADPAALLIGLVIMGMGMGCTTMPLSAAAVQSLAPRQVAHGATLNSVGRVVAPSVGAALMSVILTAQFHRGQYSTATSSPHSADREVANGVSEAWTLRPNTGHPRLVDHLIGFWHRGSPASPELSQLSQPYVVVFMTALALLIVSLFPAALLPRRSPEGSV